MTVPSGPVNAPQCVLDASFGTVTQVACGVPPFPQVDLKLAGNMKSNDAGGVRHDIKSYITQTMPEVNDPDSTPMYSGIQAALADLQAIPNMKRILMVVSDGSWDCAVFGNRGGFDDCNCCSHEWEDPQNVIKLVGDANKDPNAPVETFIVGVPGADTVGVQGQGGCGDMVGCDWPPYAMRAALSAIAFSGSPTNVPANCTGKTFTQATPNPQTSCHFDMTQGNFNTMALTTAISQVRGKVLGCTFDLPALDGGMVDPTQVNVDYSINGGMQMDLVKRADPNNPCTQMGCWDYTDANQNKIQLIGKACDDIQNNMNTKVDIVLGCATVIG